MFWISIGLIGPRLKENLRGWYVCSGCVDVANGAAVCGRIPLVKPFPLDEGTPAEYSGPMRASKLHIVTYREDPADAEVLCHKLMARAGLIFKLGSGVYAYSPLLWRSLKKAHEIIRRELDRDGALELQLPIMQDQSLWEESGRWEAYKAAGVMLSTTDRRGLTFGLAPTAEEVVTAYMRATAKSYKQLPVTLYQIHTKFRDEIRPRFGLLRVKEFLMKDAYSFDKDEAGLDQSYEAMRLAYHRIFSSMGLEAFGVDADPGDIGGSGSMEFMLPADTGEDTILFEPSSGYAANVEKACSGFDAPPDEEPNHFEWSTRLRFGPVKSCMSSFQMFLRVAWSRPCCLRLNMRKKRCSGRR